MYVTTNLGSGSGNGYCDVWNRNDGPIPSWWHAKCTQQYLSPGAGKGGGSVDVDAFTYNDRGYWAVMWGTWTWHNAGVWTKIYDGQRANCAKSWGINSPVCYTAP